MFKKGHKVRLGSHHSEETKLKMRLAKLGKSNLHAQSDKNPMWKGNKVGRSALHTWLSIRLPKPEFCQICNEKPPYDLTNISPVYNPETYNRDFKNWVYLCRSCHIQSDGRLNNLKQYCVQNLTRKEISL